MKFPPKPKTEYEKVPTGEFVNGVIQEIQYDEKHVFKGADEPKAGVRLKFTMQGCQFPHYSRWMTFGNSEKSKLYTDFIQPLVEGAKPYKDFDLEILKGMKVKMLWVDNEEYQNLKLIQPLEAKVNPDEIPF